MKLFSGNHFRTAVIALIIANVIWGAAPPIFKWALQDVGPFTLAFLRFAFATVIIFPFAYKYLKVEKQDIAEFFLIGFLGVVINISFFFMGLKYAPSINATIIGSAGPVFLIIAGFMFLKERPKNKLIVGAAIGLMGVLLIILKPLLSEEPNLDLLGNIFFFIAMLGALGHTILGRQLMKKYEAIGPTFWSFAVGTLCFFPLFAGEMSTNNFSINLTFPVVSAIIFGAVLCSSVAYFLFFWALKYMQAAETGVFTYLDPIVTLIVAFPLLGEKPDLLYFMGAAFVFLGIYIAEGRLHYHPIHLLRRRS